MGNFLKSSFVAGSKLVFTACSSVNTNLKSHAETLPGRLSVLSKSPSPFVAIVSLAWLRREWRPFTCLAGSSCHGTACFFLRGGGVSFKGSCKAAEGRELGALCVNSITTYVHTLGELHLRVWLFSLTFFFLFFNCPPESIS